MPSDLRNGKDLSFEQLRAAERRKQQQRAAGIAARDSYVEPLSPSDRPGTDGHSAGASNHPLATPLAPLPLRGYEEHESSMLMRLEEIDQLEMEPAYQPNQGIAPSEVFSRAPSTALASARSHQSPSSGETQIRRLVPGSPAPLDGWVYDADRDSPLSPYERSAQGQRNVYRPLAPQPGCSQRARDVHRHRDTSPGQAHDDLQHIPGPMAPVCQREGKRQLPPHEDCVEPGKPILPSTPQLEFTMVERRTLFSGAASTAC
ncbi:hypothetical protein PCASD_02723, partial [Puccinia coronata f. sp. avenae]